MNLRIAEVYQMTSPRNHGTRAMLLELKCGGVQSSLFSEGINVLAFEQARKGLRDLVQFIERRKQLPA